MGAQGKVATVAGSQQVDIAVARTRPKDFYIPTLDGWRAIAVMLVIGAHSVPMLQNNGSAMAMDAAAFLNHAGYGVDIFFAISGYLICTLLLAEKGRTGTISLPRFYTRRAFRILPPIVLFMGCMVAMSKLEYLPQIGSQEIISTFLFYRNYSSGTWYTGHFWSLAVEEQFYAVIPIFLLLLNRRTAIISALLLIAFCITARWYEYAHNSFPSDTLPFRTENRYDGLLWGAMLAIALRNSAIKSWLTKVLTWQTMLIALFVLVGLLETFDGQPWRRTLVAAFMPFFLAFTILNSECLVSRWLELRPLKWIGRMSYSLYIWQMPFLVRDDRPLGVLQSFPCAFACIFFCASLSYYVVEKRSTKIGHQLAQVQAATS